MTKKNIEWKIIRLALNTLKNNFQIQAEIKDIEVVNNYQKADFILNMVVQGRELRFYVEVKANITKAGLLLLQQLNNMGNLKPMLFMTRYVNTAMADELKQRGIEFIDTAGNAYINQPPLYIFVKGNKPTETFTRIPHNRAFQPTGLKLIYAFLHNADLVNKPYLASA